ncbi:MAG: hypothetical protein PVH37_06860 [Desulfobacterales bacterium]|jgi:hypothetical protein
MTIDELMNYAELKKQVRLSKQDICREVYAVNRQSIRVKNKHTVVKNLTTDVS